MIKKKKKAIKQNWSLWRFHSTVGRTNLMIKEGESPSHRKTSQKVPRHSDWSRKHSSWRNSSILTVSLFSHFYYFLPLQFSSPAKPSSPNDLLLSFFFSSLFSSFYDIQPDFMAFVASSYRDSFEPLPTPVPFQSLDSIPTYKNDIKESGMT